MRCPYCGRGDSKVLESRKTEEGAAIRRRRECEACGRRFTTYEKVEDTLLIVIKKDGRREAFDRHKILSGLIKACEKRPIPLEALEQLAGEVEAEIRNSCKGEVPSREIGERVISRLRALDEVAYVRFASVYRQFTDLDTFMAELQKLLKSSN
ncbi:MAG: transcriptional regulator NrdR [Bacillota bacterium]